jgi:hypothetical protein
MMVVRKITLRVFSYTILLVMGLFLLNMALFTHTHILPDGRVVTHAHPLNQQDSGFPSGHHSHTGKEFLVLDHSMVNFVSAAIAALLILLPVLVITRCDDPDRSLLTFHSARQGRSPPPMVN